MKIGYEEVVELASGKKLINKIPPYDKVLIILDALLELDMIQGDKEELKHELYELYSTKVMQINKKAKANNSDIIDYVKIMYGLNVNSAMIYYVRKDKGIQKKCLILEQYIKKMLIENQRKIIIKLL